MATMTTDKAEQFGSIDAARAFVQANPAQDWLLLGADNSPTCYVIADLDPQKAVNLKAHGIQANGKLKVVDSYTGGAWQSTSGATAKERAVDNTS